MGSASGTEKAKSILLEPYYEFPAEVPAEMIGRAMSGCSENAGEINPPETDGIWLFLQAWAAVSSMRDYQKEVISTQEEEEGFSCNLKDMRPAEIRRSCNGFRL